MNKQKIFITGGNGFVGAALVRRLVSEGHEVSLLVRTHSNKLRLQGLEEKVQFLLGDVTNTDSVRNAIKKSDPQVVYHLVSTPFNPPPDARVHLQVIFNGTLNILEALKGNKDVSIITAGSVAEYGEGNLLTEKSPLMPTTMLGIAKMEACHLMKIYSHLHGMKTTVLRVFTPYGPWERSGRLVSHTILSALEGKDVKMSQGDQERDYLYIDDLIEAFLKIPNLSLTGGGVYNICSGQGIKIREIAELILKLMGNPVKLLTGSLPTRPDEIWKCSGSYQAAQKTLGWQPRVSMEEGLRRTIDWFKENRETALKLT